MKSIGATLHLQVPTAKQLDRNTTWYEATGTPTIVVIKLMSSGAQILANALPYLPSILPSGSQPSSLLHLWHTGGYGHG